VKRLIWLSLGAAGGILAYRKGSAIIEQVRDQGYVVTTTQALEAGRNLVQQAQQALSKNGEGTDRGLR
jgi:hypothetical protein